MEIRPGTIANSTLPVNTLSTDSMPKKNAVNSQDTIIITPSESYSPSGQQSVNVIVHSSDKSQLEELKKAVLQAGPGSSINGDLSLIDGFSATISPGEKGQMLAKLQQSGAKITADNIVSVPEKGIKDIENALSGDNGKLKEANCMFGVEKLHEQGITGKGQCICIIDTGLAPHPDIKDRIIAFKDFVNGKTEPYDDQGHGTHCAGIAAGDGKSSGGKYVGVAPEADIIGVKVLDQWSNGQNSTIIKGIQWAIMNKHKYGIDVINLSLGGKVDSSRLFDPLVWAVQAASKLGITCVVAAGNSGCDPSTIESPGNAPSAITVGALDDQGTEDRSDDWVASFSSRGPTRYDKLAKPDIVAPGVNIVSLSNKDDEYVSMSGTSMATPFAAGVAALMKQVDPHIKPKEVKEILMNTADKFQWDMDRNTMGKGIIDPVESVEYLMHTN